MNENYPIEIRDVDGVLIFKRDCIHLKDRKDLVQEMVYYKNFHPRETRPLTITQWMPYKKGHITIGEGY